MTRKTNITEDYVKTGIVIIIIWFTILAGGFIGWVSNIVKFASCDFEAPYKAEIVYGVGLVPIVGAFTGYIDIEDGVKLKKEKGE